MYLPSTAPLPPNSQNPNTRDLVRSQARVNRIALQMARGRMSNLQQQRDYPSCAPGMMWKQVGGSQESPSLIGVPAAPSWVSAMQSLFGGTVQSRGGSAPITPTMPSLPGVVNGPTTAKPSAPTPAQQSAASNPNWTPAQKQAILDAPEMIPLEVAKVTCSTDYVEPEVQTDPRSSPPWGNAIVTTGQGRGAASFGLASWVMDHPWLSLLIAGVAGVAIKSASKR